MKSTLIHKMAVLLLVPVLYYVVFSGAAVSVVEPHTTNVSLFRPSPVGDKNFINCIFNGGLWYGNEDWIEIQLNWNRYGDSLHFNTIHLYDHINGDENGTDYYGRFLPPLDSGQIEHTNNLLSLTNNKNLKLLYERCKISKLCYAQRLVYEVGNGSTSINNGFCYTGGGGEYTTDSGRTVRIGTDPVQQYPNGYWLSTSIYENLQHSDLYNFNLQYADSGTWYMKPLIRIDSNVVDNYPEKPVVRIVVNNFQGDTIKNVVIKAKYFRDLNGNYGGQYKDVFNFDQDPVDLEVSGSVADPNGLGYGYNGDPNPSKIDFKVYWCGEVTVWFDKMTVDDFYANKLFDPNPLNNFDYNIEQEVTNFANHQGLYSFFADEITYSQLAACKYVDSVMKHYNSNARLHLACTNYLNTLGLRNNSIGHRIMLQTIQPYSINPDAHEIYRTMPGVFNEADPRFPDSWKSTNYGDYTRQMQEAVFGDKNSITDEQTFWNSNNRYLPAPQGSLVYQIELARQQIDTYSPATKLIMQPQIHMWAFYSTSNEEFLWGNREPTNEEIQSEAMLSIAHGADGLCWFTLN